MIFIGCCCVVAATTTTLFGLPKDDQVVNTFRVYFWWIHTTLEYIIILLHRDEMLRWSCIILLFPPPLFLNLNRALPINVCHSVEEREFSRRLLQLCKNNSCIILISPFLVPHSFPWWDWVVNCILTFNLWNESWIGLLLFDLHALLVGFLVTCSCGSAALKTVKGGGKLSQW